VVSWFSPILQALGLVDVGIERYVSDTGDDTEDGSELTPYRTNPRALADAAGLAAGERLVVRVSGAIPFVESLTLPSHVWLEGAVEVQAAVPGPAIAIAGTAAAHVEDVQLRDLRIRGAGPYVGNGGAVRVQLADGVTLDGCELYESVAGRGGGLAVIDSTAVVVRDCRVHDNTAGTPASALAGADIGLSMTLPAGDGHGGGIYLRDSDAEVVGCDVSENQAILFGGGIAVRNQARPAAAVRIADCQLTCNQVSHGAFPAALGAVATCTRADMGDPVLAGFHDPNPLITDEDERNVVSLLHGMNFESGLGGGIAVRMATDSTRIERCRIGVTRTGREGANRARRGGGIALYIGASPRIEDNEIASNLAGGDGGGIVIDLFDPILPPGEATAFGITAIPMVPRAPIAIERNHVHDNRAVEDGGGLYATGAGRPMIRGGTFERNLAGENGGGLRATYATQLHLEGVVIRDNQSNVVAVAADREGGGGVAARNATVHLQDCTLTGNRANAFAGGAVYFVSAWEGGFDGTLFPGPVVNERNRFDRIMEGAFGFRTRVLRVVNCRASGNEALGQSGAGGFLYAVRSPAAAPDGGVLGGAEAMWVSIEGPRTAIGANVSEHDREGMRKRGNVAIELSGLTVGTSLVPQDRVSISPELAAGAIAPSTPATPAATARAVVVMRDANAANDAALTPWPGPPGFVHGPAPTVTGVSPATASTAGGTALTVTGTGFETGLTVLVADRPATFVSNTATQVVVTTPAGPAGPAAVTVIGPSGARATLAGALTLRTP
jgi:hypothetical protein